MEEIDYLFFLKNADVLVIGSEKGDLARNFWIRDSNVTAYEKDYKKQYKSLEIQSKISDNVY